MKQCFLFLCLILGGGISYSQNNFPDIGHIIHMGQSLAAGDESLPVVSNFPSDLGNLMYSNGVYTWPYNIPDQNLYPQHHPFNFDYLTAKQSGRQGETIANGLCDNLRYHLLMANKGIKVPYFLFSYAGEGGRYLRELDKRNDDSRDVRAGNRRSIGGYYQTAVNDVRRAKYLADSLNKSYRVVAITWMQGEANNTGKLNRWDTALDRENFLRTYMQDLISLKEDFQSDVVEITSQSTVPSFFTYQTAGVMSGTAQLMACDRERDMFMVAPTYMLPNAENSYYQINQKWYHGDGIHLTADGERWLGEQFSKVIRRVMIDDENWEPLRPTSAKYSSVTNSVFVGFHLPKPPLVIDTVFLPAQGSSLGFGVYDGEGREYEIDSVVVAADTSLQLKLVNAPVDGNPIYLSYGLNSFVSKVSKPICKVSKLEGNSFCDERISIVFKGDIFNEFSKLLQEGSFHLSNQSKIDSLKTSIIVREVSINTEGNTVLTGNVCDLKNETFFVNGQLCIVSRRFSYGNIRDSDNEEAINIFQDSRYGKRLGEKYPLWNWCIAFSDYPINDE